MTLMEWFADHPDAARVPHDLGVWRVFTVDPSIWQVSDYYVSSAVSGPAVILVPKDSDR